MNKSEIEGKLKSFKGLILDGDGVFFTSQESRFVLDSGEIVIMKSRDLHDGQGLSFLRSLGILIVFVTGEDAVLGSVVEKLNNLPSVISNDWENVEYFLNQKKPGGKVAALETWLEKKGLTWSECVYIGDDRSDLEPMVLSGLRVAPNNARRVIKSVADISLNSRGGEGAIREFAEMVLDARDINESSLPTA